MAVTATNVRTARGSALLAGRQSAKGTAVTDFTAATALRLWTPKALVPVATDFERNEYMTNPGHFESAGTFLLPDRRAAKTSVHATGDALDFLLRSNYGTPSAGVYALSTVVPVWTTLAWVESTASGATEKLVRLVDAWAHRLAFVVELGSDGILRLDADWRAESDAVQALNAGGVTLPSSPMAPADKDVFACRSVTFRRDPASANVSLRVESLFVAIDQGVADDWDQMRQVYTVFRTGPLMAEVSFTALVADETWVALTNARAGTKQRFRAVYTEPVGPTTLTLDLYGLVFTFEDLGHDGQGLRRIKARSVCTHDGTNFLTVTVS